MKREEKDRANESGAGSEQRPRVPNTEGSVPLAGVVLCVTRVQRVSRVVVELEHQGLLTGICVDLNKLHQEAQTQQVSRFSEEEHACVEGSSALNTLKVRLAGQFVWRGRDNPERHEQRENKKTTTNWRWCVNWMLNSVDEQKRTLERGIKG